MKLLNSKKCLCGIDQTKIKFDKYYPFRGDVSFYGGRVDMLGERICECGRHLKGYFHWTFNSQLELIDLEVIKDITEDEKIENKGTSSVEDEDNLILVDEEAEYNPKSYDEMSYQELQKMCKEKGISASGKKEYLIAQLKKATGV